MLGAGIIRLRPARRNGVERWAKRTPKTVVSSTVSLYSSSAVRLEDAAVAAAKTADPASKYPTFSRQERKKLAHDYNNRRAAYNRQVKQLRIKYLTEYQRQRAADQAAALERQRQIARQKLERQRQKNIRSAQRALEQEAFRQAQYEKWQEHLEKQQQIRDASKLRYTKARQMIIDELEEEAPLWLTTREEVNAAFHHEQSQLLWGRPGGILGAPNPSLDCHFWQYETHTWHMTKSYPTMRQDLLKEMQEVAYEQANIDTRVWTKERVQQWDALATKAKLRAMVQAAGRARLLKRQQEMIDAYVQPRDEDDPPKPEPARGIKFLANQRALEREGAQILEQDPTKFFVFEHEQQQNRDAAAYSGPTLGAPIALRDPLREEWNGPGSHGGGTVFPEIVMSSEEAEDLRSNKERKRQEREERLLAAANQEDAEKREKEMEADGNYDMDEFLVGKPLDYDETEEEIQRESDRAWIKGIDDPEEAKEMLEIPQARRYSQEDIDWVVEQLQEQVDFYEEELRQEIEREKSSLLEKGGELERALVQLSEVQLRELAQVDNEYEGRESDDEWSDEALAKMAETKFAPLTGEQLRQVLERSREETVEEDTDE